MHTLSFYLIIALAFLPLTTKAQSIRATDSKYIKIGKMLDVQSGKWMHNQILEVNNERIVSISDKGFVPPKAEAIDLSNYYVLPGLIDLHVHLTSSSQLHGYKRLSRSIPRAAIFGVSSAQRTLKAGFTTVRNLGAAGFADVALRDAINEGEVSGPRMRVAGRMVCITGGHCDGGLLAPHYQNRSPSSANGPWEARKAVRENIKYGADVIKFAASGGVLSKGTSINSSQFSIEEMKAIVEEAHDRGRIVAAHAHSRNGIKRAIKAGVNSIEHASLIDDEGIRLAKKHGTTLVMDIYVSDYILSEGRKAGILEASLAKERQVGKTQRLNFNKAVKAGVKLAFGSDAGVYPHGLNARQFKYMVDWGMSELEAIQAATIHAAELLAWKNSNNELNVGEISVGRFADLIAVKSDPLKEIQVLESIDIVVKGGKLVE